MLGLIFTTAMLIVVEGCFVCWLYSIQLPDRQFAASGFLVVPPWYCKPRFEVTLLLTIAAGMLFQVCRGLWNVWQERNRTASAEVLRSLRKRVHAAASVAALAGLNLALAAWLR
jgi:hypothetical protein